MLGWMAFPKVTLLKGLGFRVTAKPLLGINICKSPHIAGKDSETCESVVVNVAVKYNTN